MIDITKKYQTRDGREVTLYDSVALGDFPFRGTVEGSSFPSSWTTEGTYHKDKGEHYLDLIEVYEEKKHMIDITKKYQTRDGQEVMLYCTDAPGSFPIHGRLSAGAVMSWMDDGTALFSGRDSGDLDLIEVPEGKTLWLNIYPDALVFPSNFEMHKSLESAQRLAHTDILARVKIVYKIGQFDK